jgi:hypothetical protein
MPYSNYEDRLKRSREYYRENREEILRKETAQRAANPEKKALKDLRYYKRNADKVRTRQALYYQQNKDSIKRKVKARKLGITPEEVLALEQETSCAICGKEFSSTRDQHIDHCHKTNFVRGVLCLGCNTGLGGFKDNPESLRKAALYLEDNQ